MNVRDIEGKHLAWKCFLQHEHENVHTLSTYTLNCSTPPGTHDFHFIRTGYCERSLSDDLSCACKVCDLNSSYFWKSVESDFIYDWYKSNDSRPKKSSFQFPNSEIVCNHPCSSLVTCNASQGTVEVVRQKVCDDFLHSSGFVHFLGFISPQKEDRTSCEESAAPIVHFAVALRPLNPLHTRTELYLAFLAVSPVFRLRGIGTKALDLFHLLAKYFGCDKARLHVVNEPSMMWLVRFYESKNFKIRRLIPRYFESGQDALELVLNYDAHLPRRRM